MVARDDARYDRSIQFLDRLVDWEKRVGLTFCDDMMRLDLLREALSEIGDPDRDYRIVIVAGTKGKGSTASILARLLQEHGYRTGLFTSPHLQSVRERIRMNGRIISHGDFAGVIETIRARFTYFDTPGGSRTYFESITAAALLHFAENDADFAVLEVGLGGRLDATNVTDPDLSIITSISMDHPHILGGTLERIAGEKAGIMRPGKPVVIGRQRKRIREHLINHALRLGARPIVYGEDFHARMGSINQERSRFHYREQDTRWRSVDLSLLGTHQIQNGAAAIAALGELLPERSETMVRRAMRGVDWPGRAEFLSHDPPVILDGAHNGDSAGVLARLIKQLYPDEKCLILFGGSTGKDYEVMFRRLAPVASEFILTRSSHPRGVPPEELQRRLRTVDPVTPVRIIPDWRRAMTVALARQRNGPLLVTGSLYLAGDIRSAFRAHLAKERAG